MQLFWFVIFVLFADFLWLTSSFRFWFSDFCLVLTYCCISCQFCLNLFILVHWSDFVHFVTSEFYQWYTFYFIFSIHFAFCFVAITFVLGIHFALCFYWLVTGLWWVQFWMVYSFRRQINSHPCVLWCSSCMGQLMKFISGKWPVILVEMQTVKLPEVVVTLSCQIFNQSFYCGFLYRLLMRVENGL
jgi:hypothetical protein